VANQDGRVHPIAVGDVVHRLTAKCMMARMRQLVQSLLTPLRLGGAVKAGAEAVLHTARRLITHYLDAVISPDRGFLHFSTALNLVRRYLLFQSTLEHFPAFSPWVTWCCDFPVLYLLRWGERDTLQ
jgi:hypothetical protein